MVDNPTPPQLDHAKSIIKEELLNIFPDIADFGSGSYKLSDYGVLCVVENNRVLTCKQLHDGCSPRLNGGTIRSGRKFAKKAQKKSKMKEESDFVRPTGKNKRKNKRVK